MLNKRWRILDLDSRYEQKIINSSGFDYSFFNVTPKQYLNTWGTYDYDFNHETKDLEVTFAVDDIAEALFISNYFRASKKTRIGVKYGNSEKIVDSVFDSATWQEFGKSIRLTVKFICSVISSSFETLSQSLGGSTEPTITVDTGEYVGNYRIKINVTSGTVRRIRFNVGLFGFSWNASVSANEYFVFDTVNIEQSGIVNSSGLLRAKLIDHPLEWSVENPEQMLIAYNPGSNRVVTCDNSQNAQGSLVVEVGELVI